MHYNEFGIASALVLSSALFLIPTKLNRKKGNDY